jgi:hypothetical protein
MSPGLGVGPIGFMLINGDVRWGVNVVEDDRLQIQYWLEMLRSGSALEKQGARRGLAGVFEKRSMLDEAIELLETNVRDGARSAHTLRWLARLYHEQGDDVSSFEVAVAASRIAVTESPASQVHGSQAQVQGATTLNRRTLALLATLVGVTGSTVGVLAWLLPPFMNH